jgi:YgiT-type zinc finger domain-containing protein
VNGPTDAQTNAIRRELRNWRETHPRATFAEIETAVEGQLRKLRAELVSEAAEEAWDEEHPACPKCGTGMLVRSRPERTVIVQGDEAVRLRRPYVVCPACGTGLFPPG